jgi:hypothetical protein
LSWGLFLLLPGTTLAEREDLRHQNPDLYLDAAPVADRRLRDRVRPELPKLRLQTRLQAVVEDLDLDSGGGQEDFFFKRAKLIATWKLSPSWVARGMLGVRSGKPIWDDWMLAYKFKGYLRLRLGQLKSRSSRSLLNSSGALLFVDRALSTKIFAANDYQSGNPSSLTALRGHGGGRVPGILLSNYFYTGTDDRRGRNLGFRVNAGVGFGNQKNHIGNDLSYQFRLEIHPFGNPSYRDGNFAGSKHRRLSLDLSYFRDPGSQGLDLNGDGLRTAADTQSRELLGLGGLLRRARFSFAGELHRQSQRPQQGGLAVLDSQGFFTQLGWVWHPLRWESGLRFSQVDPDRGSGRDRRQEWTVSLIRYLDGNMTKVLTEWSHTRDLARPNLDERRFRLFYQLTF